MENLSLATSGVDHQTKKSPHGTSSGRTVASESISDPRHLRSLCSASDVQFVGVFWGVYMATPTSSLTGFFASQLEL